MKRIAVVGTSCSGKTTLAKKLSYILGYPRIELDALFWGPDWTRRKKFLKDVETIVRNREWILDGHYSSARKFIWARATTVIILDLPFYVIFSRAIIRTVKRIATKEKLFNGNVESFKESFLSAEGIPIWIIRTYRKRKRQYQRFEKMKAFSHIDFIKLSSKTAVDEFIFNLQTAQSDSLSRA